MMSNIDSSRPVLITGATGYVAGWIVRRLLERGCTVHAAVRNPDDQRKLKSLNNLAEQLEGQLKFFQADLLNRGSYAKAMRGCGVVFHTASPFQLNTRDPERDLLDPAKLGTRNVIDEVNRQDSVQRVVLTSSCAAIYGDNVDLLNTEHGEFTEHDWNVTSSLRHQPYSYSKTIAEREAWRFANAQSRWDMVALNPSFILGPAITPYSNSGSIALFKSIGDGSMKMGVPDYSLGVVDVRDVADAHVRAAWTESASGRCIVSGHNTDLLGIAKRLRERFSLQFPIPRRTLPNSLVWLFGPLMDETLTRRFVRKNLGYPFVADNSKSIEMLGMKYRRLDDTVCDMFQQMIDRGFLSRS